MKNSQAFLSHVVDLPQQVALILGAEIPHIQYIVPHHLGNLRLQRLGVGVLAEGGGGEERGDQIAIERTGGIGLWHADRHHPLA